MSSQPQTVNITPLDRLSLTFCLAILTHGTIILGVTFAAEDRSSPRYDTMEIILVQQQSEAPEEAAALAQANLEGGGDTSEKVTPASPLPPPFPGNEAEVAIPPARQPPPQQAQGEPTEPSPTRNQQPASAPKQIVATTSDQAESTITERNDPERQPQEQVRPEPQSRPVPDQPSAAELITESLRVASLSAEIRHKLQARAQRPRRKFISASTREYKYAAYMEAWRAKVERIGNLNYPEQARELKLSGNLILDVALNRDGSINDIIVRRSSGHKVLDDAAKRIVNLAAPFAPFPDDIRDETDLLHITRTWRFLNNRGFQ